MRANRASIKKIGLACTYASVVMEYNRVAIEYSTLNITANVRTFALLFRLDTLETQTKHSENVRSTQMPLEKT